MDTFLYYYVIRYNHREISTIGLLIINYTQNI